jgi:hypothetical protein
MRCIHNPTTCVQNVSFVAATHMKTESTGWFELFPCALIVHADSSTDNVSYISAWPYSSITAHIKWKQTHFTI